jgi:hypothetical protein
VAVEFVSIGVCAVPPMYGVTSYELIAELPALLGAVQLRLTADGSATSVG